MGSLKYKLFEYIGGKSSILDLLYSFFPNHSIYLEPFVGSGSVFFNKPKVKHEIINDLNKDIANLMYVLSHPEMFQYFTERVTKLISSRAIFDYFVSEIFSKDFEFPDVERAVKYYYIMNLKHVSSKKTFGTYSVSNIFRRNHLRIFSNESFIKFIHERLKDTFVECLDINKFLQKYLGKNDDAFMYLDPPYYVPEYDSSKMVYALDFKLENHIEMLEIITKHENDIKMLISNYENEVYNKYLKNWNKYTFERKIIINLYQHKNLNKIKKVECFYYNYDIEKNLFYL